MSLCGRLHTTNLQSEQSESFVSIMPSLSTNICGRIDGGTVCCIGYMWDYTSRECVPCTVGYTGNDCDTKCTFPSYGHDCQMTCVCQREDCNFVNGCSQSLDVSSVGFNYTIVDETAGSFSGNITNTEDSFRTASGVDDDDANNKQSNSTPTKKNRSDGLMHATIGLAIVAILIII